MNDDGNLRRVLEGLAPRIREYRKRERFTEEDTKTKLINPVLEALGWEVKGDDVEQEFVAGRKGVALVDYALKASRIPVLFVEAKALGEKLSEDKGMDQVLYYAFKGAVKWCVLTDGDHYHLYYAGSLARGDERLFCRTQVSEAKIEDSAKVLTMFSRGNMQEKIIDDMWNAYHVDQRVRKAFLDMVDPVDQDLVKLIQKKVAGITPKEISRAVLRLRPQIDQPPVPVPTSGKKILPVKVQGKMSGLDAAAKVLAEATEPLDAKQIIERAAAKGYWSSTAPTPAATIRTAIRGEIAKKGDQSRFTKTGRGLFTVTGAGKQAQ